MYVLMGTLGKLTCIGPFGSEDQALSYRERYNTPGIPVFVSPTAVSGEALDEITAMRKQIEKLEEDIKYYPV